VPPASAQPMPGSECPLAVAGQEQNTNDPILVHEQFHLGTFLMKRDSVEAAVEAFRPVAALWQPNMSGLSDNCQQYIQVAKAFVDASDASSPGLPRPGADRADITPDKLLIAPNPADNTALVSLRSNDVRVSVWDTHGMLIHQGNVTANTYLFGYSWQIVMESQFFCPLVTLDSSMAMLPCCVEGTAHL